MADSRISVEDVSPSLHRGQLQLILPNYLASYAYADGSVLYRARIPFVIRWQLTSRKRDVRNLLSFGALLANTPDLECRSVFFSPDTQF